jgi:uncharacterized protein YgbK (DUF1537 family)
MDGLNSIYRTAASFVSSRAGLEPKGLLTAQQLREPTEKKMGGLIVVGSYVPKTTQQLSSLLDGADIKAVELSVRQIIEASRKRNQATSTDELGEIIKSTAALIDTAISSGKDVVMYTTREFLAGTTLVDAAAVSDTLTEIVRQVSYKPAFLVAKGGITSHDVAFKSLSITTARVVGQIEPGVPVWKVRFIVTLTQGSLFVDIIISTLICLNSLHG